MPGVDNLFGYGRINSYESLALGACPVGETKDCNGNCAPTAWIADGTCDNGARLHDGNLIDFSCVDFLWDDCTAPRHPFILWRNASSNQHAIWFMNGAALMPETNVLPTVSDPNWTVVGTGDFDGDGSVDLLWRNSATGQNVLWFLIGTYLTPTSVSVPPVHG